MVTLSWRNLGTRSRYALAILMLAFIGLLQPNARGASIVGPLSGATGIDGLNVDGISFNVTFTNAPYSTAFPTNNPYYNGNSSGGADATNAIGIALSAAGVSGIAGESSVGGVSIFVPVGGPIAAVFGYIPSWGTGNSGQFPTVWGTVFDTPGGANFGDTNPGFSGAKNDFWAVFTPASTVTSAPEPGTLALLGLGVVGVGLSRRRRIRPR